MTLSKTRIISISYPKTPGSEAMIEQQIEIPPNVGLASMEMILNAINEQTSLIAHIKRGNSGERTGPK